MRARLVISEILSPDRDNISNTSGDDISNTTCSLLGTDRFGARGRRAQGVCVLIVSPTRELAQQIEEEANQLLKLQPV